MLQNAFSIENFPTTLPRLLRRFATLRFAGLRGGLLLRRGLLLLFGRTFGLAGLALFFEDFVPAGDELLGRSRVNRVACHVFSLFLGGLLKNGAPFSMGCWVVN